MTHEEAHTKLMAETRNGCTPGAMTDFIDMAVALGMLKLDEPKSLRSKTIDALIKYYGGHDIETIFDLLEKANLQIVEK